MCLILFAINPDPATALVVAANRDEFHARPTREADWWPDRPDIYGGRDLLAGGTWLAIARNGRFAAVTNYRDAEVKAGKLPSRGALVADFLDNNSTATDYLAGINGTQYAGFNLIVFDGSEVGYYNNEDDERRVLGDGIYGISNADLDAPWHKVVQGKQQLARLLDSGTANRTELLRLLADRSKAPAQEVDSSRLGFKLAHALTAGFIVQSEYGTRCSSAVQIGREGDWRFIERRFDANGQAVGDSRMQANATAIR